VRRGLLLLHRVRQVVCAVDGKGGAGRAAQASKAGQGQACQLLTCGARPGRRSGARAAAGARGHGPPAGRNEEQLQGRACRQAVRKGQLG
jgi:hypothetical protein